MSDVLVKFDGYASSRFGDAYAGWFNVGSITWDQSMENPSSSGGATLTRSLDQLSPALVQKSLSGSPFRYVRIHVMDSGAPIFKVYMVDVYVTAVSYNSAYDGLYMEVVTLESAGWWTE